MRSIALEGALDRTAEVRRSNAGKEVRSQPKIDVGSTANDRTWAVIDCSYRMGTCGAERELEQKD